MKESTARLAAVGGTNGALLEENIMLDTKKYAGKQFYALVARMGGMFTTIHALALYRFNARGVPHKAYEAMSCVANRAQYKNMHDLTAHCGYISGRPTLARMQELSAAELDKLVS